MQKKIIALAIAAAFSAPAFADVTVYGVVDAAVARVSASGQKSDTLVVSGGLSSSRLGVKSAEDLDNGMKAVVVLEYGLDTQASTGLSGAAARQQMLALAGGFGTVATGYLQTTGYDFGAKFDPTSGSTVTPLGNITAGGGFMIGSSAALKRASHALAYISPDMGGVTVAVNYASDTTVAGLGNLVLANVASQPNVKGSGFLWSVTYSGGPVTAGVVYAALNPAADGTYTPGVREYAIGASYDLSVVKLFATYQSQKVGGAVAADKVMSFSAVAPVGPGAVAFSYAKSSMGSTTIFNSATNSADGASGYTVAYLQGLSKMTTMYVALSKMKQDSGTTAYSVFNNGVAGSTAPGWVVGGGKSTQVAVGLNKKF